MPFPKVEARIVNQDNQVLVQADHESGKILSKKDNNEPSGDLQIRGPNVFKEYFNRPEATEKEFTNDGWFKTGDTAQFDGNSFKILGRSSVDIIKSGGYKISALHVERLLLENPAIQDIAVVGLEDLTWGQKVAAVIVLDGGSDLTLEDLRRWCKGRMPDYLIPTVLKVLDEMPRNHMGKVNKKELVKSVFK